MLGQITFHMLNTFSILLLLFQIQFQLLNLNSIQDSIDKKVYYYFSETISEGDVHVIFNIIGDNFNGYCIKDSVKSVDSGCRIVIMARVVANKDDAANHSNLKTTMDISDENIQKYYAKCE